MGCLQVGLAAHGDVVGAPAGMAECLHGLGFQSGNVGRAQCGVGAQGLGHGLERGAELHGLLALGRAQVAIARGQRQAVFAALGFTADDVDGHGELLDHVADHHQLLVVLLAEQCGARLRQRQQLQHHSAHADEEAGAEVAFQDVCQLGRRVHLEALGLGIHLGLFGGKDQVATGGFQLLAVGIQRARIGVKVFVRCKLQAVHKDGGHGHIAQRLGLAHQRQMPCMQVAHGGDDGGVAVGVEFLAQLGDGVDDFHRRMDGGIYARDTTEPALPGRRYRPLEGEAPQALRGGAVFTRRGWCRRGNCRS